MIHSQHVSTLGRKKKKAPRAPEVCSKSFLHSRPELQDVEVEVVEVVEVVEEEEEMAGVEMRLEARIPCWTCRQ